MSTDLETRVYNNYRAALRAQTAPRAGARRQAARKMTVERYNLPYAQVKDIVARFDAANDVTHEHTPEYLAHLEIERAQAEYDANPVPCTQCGSEEMVRVRCDPSTYQTKGEVILTTLCFRCHLVLEGKV